MLSGVPADRRIYLFLRGGLQFASQTYYGVGIYNYSYVLHDPYFLQAVRNTFILVVITVPLSTALALLISVGLSSIRALRELLSDDLFPAVCHKHAGGRPGIYDFV